MTRSSEISVKISFKDAPPWLSHLEFIRDGDDILIEVVKQSGVAYGEARLSLEEFNDIANILLKP